MRAFLAFAALLAISCNSTPGPGDPCDIQRDAPVGCTCAADDSPGLLRCAGRKWAENCECLIPDFRDVTLAVADMIGRYYVRCDADTPGCAALQHIQHAAKPAVYQYWQGLSADPAKYNGWCQKVWDIKAASGNASDFTLTMQHDDVYPPAWCPGPSGGETTTWRYVKADCSNAVKDLPPGFAGLNCWLVGIDGADPTTSKITAHLCTRMLAKSVTTSDGETIAPSQCPGPDANGYPLVYPPNLETR
ncbi:MAG: hypothetical protein KC503_20985 [Myxococcales bacterium]|nr:hypothetical protein [Myxococcales bacterium]